MAMNKKEVVEVERLKQELRLKGALRATSNVEPDVAIPTYDAVVRLSKGFLVGGETSAWPRVEPACSSSAHHNFGNDTRTSTLGAQRLYSTRLLATRALRYAVEQDCCARLAKVDEMIEKLSS